MDIDQDARDQAVRSLDTGFSILYADICSQKRDFSKEYDSCQLALFILTRITLMKLWQFHGLIDQHLCRVDTYDDLDRLVKKVLEESFGLTNDTDHALPYQNDPKYGYRPDTDILKSVSHQLWNLKCEMFDTDLLGNLYENHIDHEGRKDTGQYYTPPEVINYIWRQVGLRNTRDFFHDHKNYRYPKLIFDPAAGSGGFLLEAARRLISDIKVDFASLEQLLMIREAFSSLHGSEIQTFPSYLARVNLMIQLTPIIKALEDRGYHSKPELSLSVYNRDSLGSYNNKLKYDYVCSNPPFIGEKGNKDLFRSTLQKHLHWKRYYQGKMDYSYWFIILGLSKLKEGGKLGFVTTAYWPTADGASKLRKYILDHAIIKEIVDLSGLSVFGTAPGQHNMIVILERSDDSAKRATNSIKTVKLKKLTQDSRLPFHHLEKHVDKKHYSDEYIDVFASPMAQGRLSNNTWNLYYTNGDLKILKKISQRSVPLKSLCHISQGIISGADKVTKKNIKLLSSSRVSRCKIGIGDGIFVLTSRELKTLNLDKHEMSVIKPFCKNSDIIRYRVKNNDRQFLIYVTQGTDIDQLPRIKNHLQKYRPILENKRECREGKLPWFGLHWPRNDTIFRGNKIITPNRAATNTFAYIDSPLYAMSDVFFIIDGNQKEDLRYVLAILNSSLMEFWFSKTQKMKGQVREYVGTPLSEIPIYQIDFSNPAEKDMHDRLVSLSYEMTIVPSQQDANIQRKIDEVVLELYSLKPTDIPR